MPVLKVGDRLVTGAAIVFDKDGVLNDLIGYWTEMTRRRVAFLDPPSPEDLMGLLGVPAGIIDPDGPLNLATRRESALLATGHLYIRRRIPWFEAKERVEQAFDAADRSLPPESTTLLPGIREAVENLQAQGWKLGVATMGENAHATASLAAHGLDTAFGAICGADEVTRGKPDPALFLLACTRLGVAPGAAIVVGDSLIDIRMGRAGGCAAAIGVLSGITPLSLLEIEADLVLPGAWDLPSLCMPQ